MVESHTAALDALVESKKGKKAGATTEECKTFCMEWNSLTAMEGFTECAEKYLYAGVSFCGAEHFWLYLSQSEDRAATIRNLVNGQQFGKDGYTTFRLLTHLLTLLLNNHASSEELELVVTQIPYVYRTKDGNAGQYTGQALKRYFFAQLSRKADLQVLNEVQEQRILNDFVSLLESGIAYIRQQGKPTKSVVIGMEKVQTWIDAQTAESPKAVEAEPLSASKRLSALLQQSSELAMQVESESVQQENRISALQSLLEDERGKFFKEKRQLEDQTASLQRRLSKAEEKISELNGEIHQKEEALSEKETEIASLTQISDILSRDQEKRAEEVLQRIASKLRIEYVDFQDAIDLPMDSDLGENLRAQIKNIFYILEHCGVKLQKSPN